MLARAFGSDRLTALPADKGKGTGKSKGSRSSSPKKGICYEFQKMGKCGKTNCPYEHKREERARSPSPPRKGKGKGKRKGKSRSPSPTTPAFGAGDGSCHFYKLGACKNGQACKFPPKGL